MFWKVTSDEIRAGLTFEAAYLKEVLGYLLRMRRRSFAQASKRLVRRGFISDGQLIEFLAALSVFELVGIEDRITKINSLFDDGKISEEMAYAVSELVLDQIVKDVGNDLPTDVKTGLSLLADGTTDNSAEELFNLADSASIKEETARFLLWASGWPNKSCWEALDEGVAKAREASLQDQLFDLTQQFCLGTVTGTEEKAVLWQKIQEVRGLLSGRLAKPDPDPDTIPQAEEISVSEVQIDCGWDEYLSRFREKRRRDREQDKAKRQISGHQKRRLMSMALRGDQERLSLNEIRQAEGEVVELTQRISSLLQEDILAIREEMDRLKVQTLYELFGRSDSQSRELASVLREYGLQELAGFIREPAEFEEFKERLVDLVRRGAAACQAKKTKSLRVKAWGKVKSLLLEDPTGVFDEKIRQKITGILMLGLKGSAINNPKLLEKKLESLRDLLFPPEDLSCDNIIPRYQPLTATMEEISTSSSSQLR